MSEDKNILDDFLERKLNSKQFELKESYWTKARKIIDEDREREQKNIFFFLFSMTTVLVVSIGLIFAESYQAVRKHNTTVFAERASSTSDAPHSIIPGESSAFVYFNDIFNENETPDNTDLSSAETGDLSSKNAHSATAENHKVIPVRNMINKAPSSSNTSSESSSVRSRKAGKADHSLISSSRKHDKNIPAARDPYNVTNEVEITGLYNLADPYIIEGRFYKPYVGSRSLSDSSLKKKDIYLQAHLREKQQRFLTATAGVNCYNPSGNLASAINFQAGLNYYYFLHPRIALSLGLIYSRLHQDLQERSYENISYSFGQVNSTTRIKTLRLDYIELPVNAYCRIYKQHYISTGASFGYLLESTERVITNTTVETQKKDNGHKQPINPYDIQLNAGYLVFLPKGFNLSLGYYFGLNDVSRNEWFKSNQFNRNSGLRIAVGYRLF